MSHVSTNSQESSDFRTVEKNMVREFTEFPIIQCLIGHDEDLSND